MKSASACFVDACTPVSLWAKQTKLLSTAVFEHTWHASTLKLLEFGGEKPRMAVTPGPRTSPPHMPHKQLPLIVTHTYMHHL